ncbi:MAG: DUF262 domain-containing protein [Atopobiaceae bacterium]|nr:DUF262 domain-containing protein [Atopobiaceae bacterium]
MDANSRKIMGLVSEMNMRFVVPVYQRPYSWGETQCVQLWDDILSTGRKRGSAHFTGSIVTIQDGSMSEQGVTPLLLIDGQQRITTIMLLLIALARYAERHADKDLPFSRDEIVQGGYLTNRFRTGEDHYKLTLSKTDRAFYQALVDSVEAGGDAAPASSDPTSRLSRNLALFEARVEALDDVASVWAGLQRLEVVSIALAQGFDDPQVIFESMNSTGKDLSTADLVRNFVLMGYPVAEQGELYRTYWRPIEETLGVVGSSYDDAFDDFIRCYLTVANAPELFTDRDAYPAFKRHVLSRGYAEGDRMKVFALRLRRFAGYYAAAVRGAFAGDDEITDALRRIGWLDVPAAVPLLMELLDGYERKDFSRESLLEMLCTLESYLFRRAVCDCEGSALAAFLPSLAARVSATREEEGNVAQVLVAALLNEEGTSRRFPSDEEFAHALRTRDMFGFAGTHYLLARVEDEANAGALEELMAGSWGVEHVLPVGALKMDEWREALGDDPERAYEEHLGALGNLVLTDAGFDLQECALYAKLGRLRPAGRLAMWEGVEGATIWGGDAIAARTEALAAQALAIWQLPQLSDEDRRAYRALGRAATAAGATFADLFAAGVVEMDDVLVSANLMYAGRATVTSTGKIMLANGEMFDDPTAAYERFLGTVGAAAGGLNGWLYWRRGEGGPTLDELRLRL